MVLVDSSPQHGKNITFLFSFPPSGILWLRYFVGYSFGTSGHRGEASTISYGTAKNKTIIFCDSS